jgi:hypothetical protein
MHDISSPGVFFILAMFSWKRRLVTTQRARFVALSALESMSPIEKRLKRS